MKKFFLTHFWGIQDIGRVAFTLRMVLFMMILQGLLNIKPDIDNSFSSTLALGIVLFELVALWLIGLNILRRCIHVGLSWRWSVLAIVPYVNFAFYFYLALKPSSAD